MIELTGQHRHAWRYAERLRGFDVLLVCECGELLRKTIPDGSTIELADLLDATDALPEDAGGDERISRGYASGWTERREAIEAAFERARASAR